MLSESVLSELAQAVEWIVFFNRFGNPIRPFVGMKELRIMVDAGTGLGWRIDGQERRSAEPGTLGVAAARELAARAFAGGLAVLERAVGSVLLC